MFLEVGFFGKFAMVHGCAEGSATSLNHVRDFEILGFHRISRFQNFQDFRRFQGFLGILRAYKR